VRTSARPRSLLTRLLATFLSSGSLYFRESKKLGNRRLSSLLLIGRAEVQQQRAVRQAATHDTAPTGWLLLTDTAPIGWLPFTDTEPFSWPLCGKTRLLVGCYVRTPRHFRRPRRMDTAPTVWPLFTDTAPIGQTLVVTPRLFGWLLPTGIAPTHRLHALVVDLACRHAALHRRPSRLHAVV
jgi:hypothetical protein